MTKKGQSEVMEYIALMFMIMLVIIFVLAMIFGFQFISAGAGEAEDMERASLATLQRIISSKALGGTQYQKLSFLDGTKLTVATCEDVESLFGAGIWINVTAYHEIPDCTGLATNGPWQACNKEKTGIEELSGEQCTDQNYPDCGYWEFCSENIEERMSYRSVPVNIYDKAADMLGSGVVTIGIGGFGS